MNSLKSLILILLSATILNLSAQYLATPKLSGVGLPFFQAGIFRTFSKDGLTRIVKIQIQMVNDDLTFISENNRFFSEIQFEIYINNVNNEYVFNRTLNKQIVCDRFNETNSRLKKNTFVTEVLLKAGKYDAVITVLDKNSNKQLNRKIHFEIEDIKDQQFLISDIIFFHKFKKDSLGNIKSFVPNLNSNFSGVEKFIYFYFSSVVNDTSDTININYNIRTPSGGILQSNQYSISNGEPYKDHYIRINRQQFNQSRYLLELIGHYNQNTMKTKKLFSFYWTVLPESSADLSKALKQMRYIPEADSINWVLKQTYDKRLKYFKKFWRRMDPNPESKKNELLDEYFRRVNIANVNFSTLSIEGWETDRGRIFIKFSEPDDIERHPFEINSLPYEIWRYYDLRKIFLFVDRTGFGDYYLHPSYLTEEYD